MEKDIEIIEWKTIPVELKKLIQNYLESEESRRKMVRKLRIDKSGYCRIQKPIDEGAHQHYLVVELLNGFNLINTIIRTGWEGDSPQGWIEGQRLNTEGDIPSGYAIINIWMFVDAMSITLHVSKDFKSLQSTKALHINQIFEDFTAFGDDDEELMNMEF